MRFSIISACALLSTLAAAVPTTSLTERAPAVGFDCGWVALSKMGTGPTTVAAVQAALKAIDSTAWSDAILNNKGASYATISAALNNLVHGHGSAQGVTINPAQASQLSLTMLEQAGMPENEYCMVFVVNAAGTTGHIVNGRYNSATKSEEMVDFQTQTAGQVYTVPAGWKITNVLWWKRA